MYRTILLIFLAILFSCTVIAQNRDEKEILDILERQTEAWNRGDLNQFMKGYWESDSLMYIGKSGVTYGYNPTLNSYKKNYSDTARMGKLSFEILHLKPLGPDWYFVVGKWFLKRSVGDIGGHYTLLFHRQNGTWVIVADHSS